MTNQWFDELCEKVIEKSQETSVVLEKIYTKVGSHGRLTDEETGVYYDALMKFTKERDDTLRMIQRVQHIAYELGSLKDES